MAITLAALQSKIHRILDDLDEDKYTEDMINDGVHAAFDAIMPWVPMLASVELDYTSGSNSGTVFNAPSDCYLIEAVYSLSGVPIAPAVFSPNSYRGVSVETNDWISFPQDKISFSNALTENVLVYYLAYWPKITDRTSNVGVPSHVIAALTFYASAYCLIPEGISAAGIRQFNTKVDSGNPDNNPVAIRVNELLKLFESEMKRHQAHMKASRI